MSGDSTDVANKGSALKLEGTGAFFGKKEVREHYLNNLKVNRRLGYLSNDARQQHLNWARYARANNRESEVPTFLEPFSTPGATFLFNEYNKDEVNFVEKLNLPARVGNLQSMLFKYLPNSPYGWEWYNSRAKLVEATKKDLSYWKYSFSTFLKVIPIGADLDMVDVKVLHWCFSDEKFGLVNFYTKSKYSQKNVKTCEMLLNLYEKYLTTGSYDKDEWKKATIEADKVDNVLRLLSVGDLRFLSHWALFLDNRCGDNDTRSLGELTKNYLDGVKALRLYFLNTLKNAPLTDEFKKLSNTTDPT